MPALGVAISDSQTHTGYTLGGGVEYLFTPNWSAKAEYMYTSLGGKTYNLCGDPLDSGNHRLPHHQGRRELSLQVKSRTVGWAKRSVPTIQIRMKKDGGHGTRAFAHPTDHRSAHTTSSTSSIVISTGLSPRISRPSAMPPR